MAGVFRTVRLGWKGEEYEITPNMAVLNKIEDRVSLSRLAHRMATGDPPLSQLATTVAILLREAGAAASDEEVYQEMMHGSNDAIAEMTSVVMLAVFPQTDPKKGEAPSRPRKTQKK